jgi:hypothetical protein
MLLVPRVQEIIQPTTASLKSKAVLGGLYFARELRGWLASDSAGSALKALHFSYFRSLRWASSEKVSSRGGVEVRQPCIYMGNRVLDTSAD